MGSVHYQTATLSVRAYENATLGVSNTHENAAVRRCTAARSVTVNTWHIGYLFGYGYCLPPYGTPYRSALRTTRTRTDYPYPEKFIPQNVFIKWFI